MTPAELAGGPGFGGAAGLPGRIEESFRRRLELLPEPTRRLVLLAAADPAGDAALLWRACALAGIDPEAAGPAQDAGLVQVGTRVRFFHPLVRSAVFRAASAQERRAAHGVLAAATDAAAYPDRRAWHRAQAAPGPDEQVAAELADSAEQARARGGVAAAAAFLERAAALTLDSQRRSARALAAAQAWHQAGGHDRAVELLEIAEAGPLGELGRARAERLRAQVIFVRTDGRDGTVQLLRAAQRLDPLDPELARATYVDAMRAAYLSGDTLETGRVARHVVASTRVVDAMGRRVIPGLVDSHMHVIRTGLHYLLELRWDGIRWLSQALAMLAEQAARTRRGSGCGWSAGGARTSSPSSGCPQSAN
jgi:hypothetical protein